MVGKYDTATATSVSNLNFAHHSPLPNTDNCKLQQNSSHSHITAISPQEVFFLKSCSVRMFHLTDVHAYACIALVTVCHGMDRENQVSHCCY